MTFFGEPPEPAQVEAWNRTYLAHHRDPENPTRCAVPDCPGRFPCTARLDAAELLILSGVGVPPHRRLSGVTDPVTQRRPVRRLLPAS